MINRIFSFFLRKEVIFFISILLIAITLRFYMLGKNPASLDWDEASMGYNVYSLLHTGADEYGNKLPLEIRSFDDYKPPMYTYLTIPSIALFGLNNFGIRLPAAIFGVLGVVIVFFLTKELLQDFSNKDIFAKMKQYLPFVSMLVLTFSPWHIQFSRAAFEGNVGASFFMIGLLFFLKGMRKGWYFFLSSFFFILSMYSYHSFRLIVLIFLIIGLLFFWKLLWKQKLYVFSSFVLLLLLAFPIYQSFLMPTGSHARLAMVTIFDNGEFLQPSIAQLEKSKEKHDIVGMILNNRRVVYVTAIISGYFSHFSPNFLFFEGDGGKQHHAVNVGMLYLWDLPFLLVGVWFILSKKNKKLFFLLLLVLVGPIPASITTGTPHPVRAISMMPFLHMIIAIGIIWVCLKLLRQRNEFIKFSTSAFIVVLFVLNFIYYLHQYYIVTPKRFAVFWQYGYEQVFHELDHREGDYEKIIVTYYYDQPYIYYLLFNKIDPAWYQQHWNINGTGTVDRMYRVIGKYEFRRIDWTKDSQRKKTLIVAAPSEVPRDSVSLKDIYFPDGKIAFRLLSL